jgi:cell division septation protein DedD
LTSLQPLHAFAVVMIDEAQNLPTTLLEEIRILSDMEHGQKLLQLVLIGQPELQARLSMPEMRQLKQRLTVRCELDPLAQAEVGPYISHRLGIAGNNNKLLFEADAIDLIYAASAGIPRVINLLCDRALFRAAAAGATAVSAEHIVGAADDLWIPWGASATPVLEPPVTAPSSAKPTEQILLEPKRRSPATRQGLPSTYQMRHDAHYVEELETRRERAVSEPAAYESPDSEPAILVENRPTKRILPIAAVAVAALVLSAASVWLLRSSANQESGSPSIETARESTSPPPDNRPANVASPEGAPSAALSPPPATPQPAVVSSAGDAPKFAVQMATFRTGARATESVRELGAAGYDAFIAEVSLRDGGRAFAVFLGPYTDRTAAGRNLERAQLLPGYGIGRIVQMGPTTSGSYRWQAE